MCKNCDSVLLEALKSGRILFMKNGKIEDEQAPFFGSVTLHYADGKLTLIEKKETKK